MQKDSNSGNDQGYCYGQGYDAASGNYDPSTAEAVGQGFDALVCDLSGNKGAYEQGYKDGYNQTNPFAGISRKSDK
ncbi:unnamed protein product [Paramecium primaurelia]|uniref:Uncharacterized protein n=1 Tax=Paramecium primaurelia TaxID=5886 RepID=A0A8S1QGR6_PARPR|nr:unnamed protein product [Paramecium primaurelia]